MIHRNRDYRITDLHSIDDVARELKRATWTGCTGFRAQGVIVLNDSFSPDGAQEYAVVAEGRQVESLTVSWMSEEALASVLARLGSDPASRSDFGPVKVGQHGSSCGSCA